MSEQAKRLISTGAFAGLVLGCILPALVALLFFLIGLLAYISAGAGVLREVGFGVMGFLFTYLCGAPVRLVEVVQALIGNDTGLSRGASLLIALGGWLLLGALGGGLWHLVTRRAHRGEPTAEEPPAL